ncbi:MAG: CHAT domain-containing protein, partial [Holophagales bacterium]|nr:CHAT domain-containing protein [Holophagales bacterium]
MREAVLSARRRASIDVHFFEIAFQSAGADRFRIQVRDSRGREITLPWRSPLSEEETAALIDGPTPASSAGALRWDSPRRSPLRDLSAPPSRESPGESGLEEVGRRLFDSLFRDASAELAGELYREDVGWRGESLSIVLTFDPTDDAQMRLFALPWEWLHGGRDHLALAGRAIVRRLRSREGEVLEPLSVRKLRILAVPLGTEGLDIAVEIRILRSIRQASGAFELEILEESISLFELRRRLEEGGFHVLHLMGHGHWSEAEGAWGVEFAGTFVTAEDLATQLRGELSDVRMVVLNTCHSGRTLDPETAAATRGLASVLVDRGALAVVANRAPISDAAAHALTLGLYDRVAGGWPLPQALTATRLDLEGRATEGEGVREGEWATPLLHLRSPGRVLVVEPRRWPLFVLASVVGCALGLVGLLATAGVWLVHPEELTLISLPIAGILLRLSWGWLRDAFSGSHPLSGLADALAAKP